jgi:4'-phosphopantetheinyl transferase
MVAAASISEDARSFGCEVQRLRVSEEVHRLDNHWAHLDRAERQRAERYRIEADRVRYIIARSSLRQLLGRRIGTQSGEIRFGENEFGKPFVEEPPFSLHFNTSHSGDWVLHAVNTFAPVGIDVEAIRAELAHVEQFERVLSPEELAVLNEVPLRHRARTFAMVWVRKEAYVKALGEGMSRPLQDISIVIDATDRCPRLLYDRNEGHSPGCWRFEDIELDVHHAACMVYRTDVNGH